MPGHRVCPGTWRICMTPVGENRFSLCQRVSTAANSLVSVWTLVHFAVSISENERTLPGRGGTERGEHLSLLCTSPAFLSQVGRLRPCHNCTFWDTSSHPVWSGGLAGCPIHSLPLAPLEKTFLFLEVQLA